MPPSKPLLTAILLGAASAALGFYLGRRNARSDKQALTDEQQPAHADDTEEDEEDDEVGEIADGDLSAISAGFMEPCKMVLVVRTDLKMTTGKISAQCGHGTLACYKALMKANPKLVRHWERTGQAKIALKAKSEEELLELEAIAKSLNLCARSVVDGGRTQVEPGTRTVLAIGPAPIPLINEVTGALRLL